MNEPKHCNNCGRDHDDVAWQQLEYCGVMSDEVESLELRHCPCGSTLSVEMEVAE
jgi:hypothetical protein